MAQNTLAVATVQNAPTVIPTWNIGRNKKRRLRRQQRREQRWERRKERREDRQAHQLAMATIRHPPRNDDSPASNFDTIAELFGTLFGSGVGSAISPTAGTDTGEAVYIPGPESGDTGGGPNPILILVIVGGIGFAYYWFVMRKKKGGD